jgi:hypothetical protein
MTPCLRPPLRPKVSQRLAKASWRNVICWR